MTFQTTRPVEQTEVTDLNTDEFGAPESDAKVREACRILRDVRAVLDTDPVAARGHVERLAKVLGATACMDAADGSHRGGLAPWQARRLREYIAANLCDPLPLSD